MAEPVKVFNPHAVSYLAEPVEKYMKAISDAATLAELQQITKAYRPIANDAYHVASKMTEADWPRFVEGRTNERANRFDEANFDLTGPILMPGTMLKISMIAIQYVVPWGVVYNRLKEFGQLTISLQGIVKVNIPVKGESNGHTQK